MKIIQIFEKYFKEQSEERHNISLEKCWVLDFKYFKELNIEFDCLLIIVEFFFSLPTWFKCSCGIRVFINE